ncbi:sensor histidine kinase [Undibacterium sp.]|jgi:two-component system OmpR family sensor kinase|uniref:sensor histidine kinase n=1 Tax=Undibacterium sp. TaxID=1914977 RepID=UPI002C0B3A0D|nr:ATP-binding protein [Undibacterium sp.]HTD03880.1 ATP-binding protein [Undibacterium sp.]
MDGLKRRVTGSLQIRLSLWLSLAILSVALIAGIFSFFSAFDEAHELQDDVLRQIATLFDRHHLNASQESDADRAGDGDAESRVFVQLLTAPPSDSPDRDARPPLALSTNLVDGMQTVRAGNEDYRVLVRTLNTGQRLAVAQGTSVRDEIARDSALRTLMPFLILVPILLLVVADLVRKIFKPVADLSIEIDQRGEQELHPIASKPLPAEIRPFVGAINRLLERVEQSVDAQRRFIVDAAHELRSPLTALSLQAERLADTEMSVDAHERLNTLRQGIERGRTLLDQLLALARAQASASMPSTTVSAQQVFRRVLEDLMPLAEVKGIDIGVVSGADAQVLADEVDLIILVKNLVDNAIRYTPAGGRVDLSVLAADEVTTLVVEDNGPGIPEAERARVFDPFYRVLGSGEIGSGLGLSIVETISARVGAKVSLGFASDHSRSGLRVMVTFPSTTP